MRGRSSSASTFSRVRTTQAVDRGDILNIGGFSDTVFEAVANFAEGKLGPSHWVGEIEKIAL